MKKCVLIVLAAFLISGVSFANGKVENQANKSSDSKFVVYYFMYLPRCMTCSKIENDTKDIVTKTFKKEIDSGNLTFKTVDIEQKENSHFKNDFQLFTKSVVLVEEKNGKVVKHQNLQKIWELIHSPEKYNTYIVDSVKQFIKK